LADMSERNMLVKGQKIVIAGFGGGLSWGSIALEL
jgi:3-oxoacyl-[acyl-carrier-protein] synthase III